MYPSLAIACNSAAISGVMPYRGRSLGDGDSTADDESAYTNAGWRPAHKTAPEKGLRITRGWPGGLSARSKRG